MGKLVPDSNCNKQRSRSPNSPLNLIQIQITRIMIRGPGCQCQVYSNARFFSMWLCDCANVTILFAIQNVIRMKHFRNHLDLDLNLNLTSQGPGSLELRCLECMYLAWMYVLFFMVRINLVWGRQGRNIRAHCMWRMHCMLHATDELHAEAEGENRYSLVHLRR